MKLRENIFTTLLLAIGLVVHHITPGILGGMKFDFLLIFMTVALILNPKFKNTILTGFLAGMLSAMTTSFPGGQIPNIIDKMVASLAIYLLIKILLKFKNKNIAIGIVGGLGTLVSGMVFLTSASILVGLPVAFTAMITGIVLPTALVNTLGTIFIFKIVNLSMRRSGINIIDTKNAGM